MIEELIKVEKTTIGNEEVNSVDARTLYLDLGYSEANFTTWMKKEMELFTEGVDYELILKKKKQVSGTKTTKNWIITLDTAKELAMMSKTIRGKEIRNYFIQVEKVAKNILGEKRLELELKKLDNESKLLEQSLQDSIVESKLKQIKMLQDFGCNIDPIALLNSEEVKSKLPKDIGEALTKTVSDIRLDVRAYSATYLLKKFEVPVMTIDWNVCMEQLGYIETYRHKGKNFKKFVNRTNWFGYNKFASSVSKLPYQILYYEDRFLDLVQLLRNEGYID